MDPNPTSDRFSPTHTPRTQNIVVLGATGSIGQSARSVLEHDGGDRLRAWGLSAHSRWELLAEQAAALKPRFVTLTDPNPDAARLLRNALRDANAAKDTEVLTGRDGILRMVQDPETDRVLSAVVGAAGLEGTWAALEAGKTVALANKESLVVAGALIMELAQRRHATILPVDSEHNAIFQALRCGQPREVKRIILTSSGGPFRGRARHELAAVTPADALRHPTWSMGPKISIDSATLMNKALEIIEAGFLFGVSADQIEVVVHPESLIHSMVEFTDGSVIAQLSPPDMRLPIQFALTYPDRVDGPTKRMDWKQSCSLRFDPPDTEAFPALLFGWECLRRGGTAPAVVNAANEIAVGRFLDGTLAFSDIPRLLRSVLDAHPYDGRPALSDLWKIDAWGRREASRWLP